jgi:chlorite dismutase
MTPEISADIHLPEVPLTVEGASVLHQMMRFRWSAWRALSEDSRSAILAGAVAGLRPLEKADNGRQSAIFSLLGHKGDLMFVHFRRSFEELSEAQAQLSRLAIGDYLEPAASYLSIVELGLY